MTNKFTTLFVGVDTHKETHTLAGTGVACEKLCELTFVNDRDGHQEALKYIKEAAHEHDLSPLVSLEDSGGNGESFARFLFKSGVPVKTVNPVYVKRNRRYSTHPEKSDSQDALEIAVVSVQRTDKLPDFNLTQEKEFAKSVTILVKERDELVCGQTRLKNKLHWALQEMWGIHYKTVYQKNVFGKRSLSFWEKYPSALDFKKTTRPPVAKPDWLINSSLEDLPPAPEINRQFVKRLIIRLRVYVDQIEAIEKELNDLAENNYAYLLSYPGCGVVTASKLIAYVRDISRFPSEKQLAKYSGIAPRKYESGKTKRNISSTRGHSGLRSAFKTIALSQIGRRGNQKAKEYFRKKTNEGKCKKLALKCLMRQNVRIIFKIMKEQRPYYN